jgi:transposase
MTSNDLFDEARDAGIEGLELPFLSPDSGRAERLRTRCRARLVRNQQRLTRTAGRIGFARRVLAPALAGGFCVLYLAALVANTLRFYGIVP